MSSVIALSRAAHEAIADSAARLGRIILKGLLPVR